jgi:acetyltransferase-like isoleucine patch superfamily enzyme
MSPSGPTESGLFDDLSSKLGAIPVREDDFPEKVIIENPLRGLINRILQLLTMFAPGGEGLRAMLHRARGVKIGKNVWISYNVILETGFPHLITIEEGAFIGIGVIVIAHFQDYLQAPTGGVRIGRRAFIGPGVIILPDVEIGEGAVVTAGSVVTRSVPPMTLVQGNPAVPIAKCGVPLWPNTPLKEFSSRLIPILPKKPRKADPIADESLNDGK